MTKEDKQLLLADLCARLPYGVICYGITKDTDEEGNYIEKEVTNILYELHSYKCCYGLVGLMNECDIESIKPYLRPVSSSSLDKRKWEDMKVYVVFQQGSFNPRHEEKRIKGVFSSYQKAEECISNLSYGDTYFSIIGKVLDGELILVVIIAPHMVINFIKRNKLWL